MVDLIYAVFINPRSTENMFCYRYVAQKRRGPWWTTQKVSEISPMGQF